MANWTTTRLNLRYHWKAALFWLLALSVLAIFILSNRTTPAYAWVENYPGLPLAEGGLAVAGPFCQVSDCTHQGTWKTAIREAIAQWNNAGANFRFTEAPLSSFRDPCRIYTEEGEGGVAVIFADSATVCSGFESVFDAPGVTVLGYPGLAYYVLINLDLIAPTDTRRITRFLVHELGHTVGLGHPDEAGQRVEAIMNSRVIYDTLQPDDIAGIRALHGVGMVSAPLKGFLGNPRDGSSHSGISVISGWVCEANTVEIQIWSPDGGPVVVEPAAYGTSRPDTAYHPDGTVICGDEDNGFGLLFNWNNREEGEHIVDVLVDGELLDRATVYLTNFGTDFLRGKQGRYVLPNFPDPGQSVVIEWEEALQNFVIVERR